ncbi:DUF2812 domain-containing protein [Romboutsia timonensis]|uniref:DUF2812 domain-containing protein n=1 Tax=Romboutsia timonensis TaxID=1776391 RepID=UPI00248CE58B|nr:DUF2812 domain-containing protein [Romboutsia timonensis]
MRISKSKFVKLISIKEHECKALEEYLEEKALEGWMLEDIICGFLIFKKNKPQKCKFAVDIFTDNNKDEYIEYCEAGGWKYLFQHDKFLIFYTEDKIITPIQTDEEIVLKKVRKSILRSLLYNIFLIGLMISNLFTGEKNGYGFFSEISDNGALLVMASLIIIIIGAVIDTVKDGLWYFKSNRAFKINENINYPSLKSLKVKNVCFSMYMCILGLMIINLFGDIGSNKGHIFLAVFVVMCAVCISRIINILLKKYKKASKVLAVLICVVAIFISTNIIVSGRDMINYVRNESQTPIMSISDFIDMKTKTEYLYFDSSKSFLASSYTYSYEGYYSGTEAVDKVGSEVYFDYEICKSKYKWIIDKTFETYLKRYKHFEYEEVQGDNWGALTVYKSDKLNGGYLLKYKDRVISVTGSIDLSKKNIKLIKEKCINW